MSEGFYQDGMAFFWDGMHKNGLGWILFIFIFIYTRLE